MQRLDNLISEILECDVNSLPDTELFKEFAAWDSLKHVLVVVGIETTFQIKLNAGDIKRMVSLAEVRNVLKERGING